MKIVCIHQGSDLYGSDRSFLQVLDWLVGSGRFKQLTVIIPRVGPIVGELQKRAVEVMIMPLSLLSKTYLKKLQWGKIIFPLFRFRKKKKLLEKYDIVYVNTAVILDFYLLAPFIKRKKFIHIREIPGNMFKRLLTFFLLRSGATVIFNSLATRRCFSGISRCRVIYNAFEGFGELKIIRPAVISQPDSVEPLKLLVIGRINASKGQDFVVNALKENAHRNFILRIVGSTFAGNEYILEELKELIKVSHLEAKIQIIGFTEKPAALYEWCDLLLIPSRKPESFGRIAIEAMSIGKPVLAAGHGGVCEIIKHGENGFLFKPNDTEDFIFFLEQYFDNRKLLGEQGKKGKDIFREKFSIPGFHSALAEVFPS